MQILEILLHTDKFVSSLIAENNFSIYIILFAIIFSETGLVILPFLPGDSLLFTIGLFAAMPESNLNILWIFFLLSFAAFLGNWLNYTCGRMFGDYIHPKLSNKYQKYLNDANDFYIQYGVRAILLGRFVPIVRTFVPFVAGIANMAQAKFLIINLTSAFMWVGIIVFSGYYMSNFSWVKNNFTAVVYLIVLISLAPIILPKLKRLFIDK